jgi:hypothetical protein
LFGCVEDDPEFLPLYDFQRPNEEEYFGPGIDLMREDSALGQMKENAILSGPVLYSSHFCRYSVI